MRHAKPAMITALLFCVTVAAAAPTIRETIIREFGLNRLTSDNCEKVAGFVEFAARATDAMNNSGFEVWTLDQILQDRRQDIYVWSNSAGRRCVTEHFLGSGVVLMREGQSFLGDAGPLWLVVHRQGNEIKFTIK